MSDYNLPADQRKKLATELSRVLADSYSLYIKTHNFHWNVKGPMFSSLHLMFETQYTELATAVDEIAERIRALGHVAPGSYKEFSELSSIEDGKGTTPWKDMVKILEADHRKVAASVRRGLAAAEETDDAVSSDLFTRRLEVHEKTAWMLRSILEE